MDKQQFLQLLKAPAGSSLQEAEEVARLVEKYPYSQVLRTLGARVSQDHRFADAGRFLQIAAVYSGDRTQLKAILSQDAGVLAARQGETPPPPVSSPAEIIRQPYTTSIDWATAVLDDMEKLRQSRLIFEQQFGDFGLPEQPEKAAIDELIPSPETEVETKVDAPTHDTPPKAAIEVPPSTTPIPPKEAPHESGSTSDLTPRKARKQRIIELARSMAGTTAPVESPRKRAKNNRPIDLLKEIETTKGKLEPENDRQVEQNELIDQFIRTQPNIPPVSTQQPATDLAAVNAGEFGENVVSETLARILVQQGKKEKAIEVLRKLIWKYPQKKAYFAAQIEELLSK